MGILGSNARDLCSSPSIVFELERCEKQDLLNKFQMDFNQFSYENPDMREDQATIADFHQRTEDLCNKIFIMFYYKTDIIF
ncbi:unnamed protein product [Blepharisma stoltei]|uniref:Uncharacterized protein n=1 Tax=Blepharisma stoltei TaxID=1481888 RepID=A0AAU9I9T3_9CILI|nr:unnamed protein product [Blepharisma stoltei]